MNDTEIHTVQQFEEQLRQAMVSSKTALLDDLLDDNLIFINHLGQVMSKADDLAFHESGIVRIHRIGISDQRISIVGDIAIVTVRADISGTFKDDNADNTFRFTRIWKKCGNASWKVISAHSCMVS